MRWVSTRVLPEPRAGEDEQRPAGVLHRLALLRVHPGEKLAAVTVRGGVRCGMPARAFEGRLRHRRW